MSEDKKQHKDVVILGRVDFRGSNRPFGIKRKDRRQHTYVVGKTGTGKSSLMHNMILQDIANGEGLCVVDPHGELIEGILDQIPKERMKDIIYFNPADTEFHIGFNILELPDPKYKHLVASGLMGIFTKIWANVWSARMEYILNNAILALLDTPGSTLLGVPRLLVDKSYRQAIIANINDPVVKAFWVNEFEQWQDKFRNEAIAPIQNKVGQFLSTALIRNVVGQSKSTINIFDMMNENKIFLVNVSKGRIGEDNSALLGAMLITKIQLAAMERVRIPEDDREDFYLYVDEFQNFATDSFAGFLSEARKYRLNLIIAHQYVGQLINAEKSTKVRDAVFGNVGTMIVFRIGAADAEFLENEFEPEFVIQDMVNLPNYCICIKLMVDGVTTRPFSANTIEDFDLGADADAEKQIIDASHKNFSRPREEVEREINRWSGIMDDSPSFTPGMSAGGGNSGSGSFSGGTSGGFGGGNDDGGAKYPAVCTNCEKHITLPFEPTPGRPVYCKSCFAKVKASGLPGEIFTEERRSAPRQEAYASDLAGMGIEFEEGGPATPAKQSIFERAGLEEIPAAPRSNERAANPLSLNQLKPVDKPKPKHPQKQEVNIDELRSAISQSLNKTDPSPERPKKEW